MNASILLYFLMLALVLLANGKQPSFRMSLNKLGFAKTNLARETKNIAVLLAVMFALTVIMGIFFSELGLQDDLQRVPDIISGLDLAEVIVVMSVASFVEEVFFRGYLQRKTNVLITNFMFGYFHIIYGSLTEILGAFFLGLVLSWGYIRSKNLFSPIMAHFFYNLITVAVIFSVVR